MPPHPGKPRHGLHPYFVRPEVSLFEQWQPKVVAEMNDYQFKIVRMPYAEKEVKMLLIEPRGVANTGDDEAGERTAQNDVWI